MVKHKISVSWQPKAVNVNASDMQIGPRVSTMDHTPRGVAYDRLFQGRGYRLGGETFEPVPSHGVAEWPYKANTAF